jgi:hypothetical protein
MSHRNRHHEDHDHDHHDHRGHHRRGHGRHGLARRLRRAGDDVAALEQLQRDLEQATADVAARISELRETAAAPAGTETGTG